MEIVIGRNNIAIAYNGKLMSREIPMVFSLSPMTWVNPPKTSISTLQNGQYIWSDGEHVYFSAGTVQKVLDIPTHTWYDKEWNYVGDAKTGPHSGDDIWYDGELFHYSGYTGSYDRHMVLDKATSTWTTEAWSTPDTTSEYQELHASVHGSNVWTDGKDIYYNIVSSSDFTWKSWVLDKSTHTWTNKTWNILSGGSFNGYYTWYDGNNIYLSDSGNQYVLNTTTSIWTSKTWDVDSDLWGYNIWSNGAYIISSWLHHEGQSYENNQLVNVDNSSASYVAFGEAFSGLDVWTDGNDWYVGLRYKINFPPPKMTTTRLGRASLGTKFTLLRPDR